MRGTSRETVNQTYFTAYTVSISVTQKKFRQPLRFCNFPNDYTGLNEGCVLQYVVYGAFPVVY